MKVKRPYFTFYKSYYDAIKTLDNESQAVLYNAIVEYALFGKKPSIENKLINLAFTLIKPTIDSAQTKYENGKKGGRPKKSKIDLNGEYKNQNETKPKPKPNQNEREKKQTESNIDIEIEKERDIEIDIEREKEYKKFLSQNNQIKNSKIKNADLRKINFEILQTKINESKFLKSIPSMQTLVNKYDDILQDTYKNIDLNYTSTTQRRQSANPNYTDEQLKSLFTDLSTNPLSEGHK